MFIRPINITKNGKQHACWSLVESYRTERGPRQRVVAYLSKIDEAGRLGFQQVADDSTADDSTIANQQDEGAHWSLLNHSPTRERGECDVDASLILQFTQRHPYPTPFNPL